LDAIKKEYPLDKAIGYKVGELRGTFVVEAVWPAGREQAQQLLSNEAVADTTK